jgi:integrase
MMFRWKENPPMVSPPEQIADLAEFLAWYSRRRVRKHGAPPARKTLQTLASRVRGCMAIAGVDTCSGLATITADAVRTDRLLSMTAARYSSGTQRGTVDALKAFGEWAVVEGLAQTNAVSDQDRPPYVPTRAITTYPDEDLALMLKVAQARDLRWWAFLATLADTGRRVGEVLGLEWEWLRVDATPPHFMLPHTKNGRQAYVPLTERLAGSVFTPENIASMKAGKATRGAWKRSPEVYPFPWAYQVVQRRMETFCGSIAVEYRGFHALRHTKATNLLAQGVPIQAVSSLLGHASVATTDRVYNHATALQFAHYLEGGAA